jgi:chemotaxis family two-component system response regulator Rcp1
MRPDEPADRPVELLLVEDSPPDIELVTEALLEGQVPYHLHVVEDGEKAIEFLRRQGNFQKAPRPDLILLDLKMPKKHGMEVLAEIKADKHLRRIPVIVLTSSDSPADILQAYDLQASCFITKPSDLDEFNRVIGTVRDFCLTIVKLPPE